MDDQAVGGRGRIGAAHAFVKRVQQEPDLLVMCMGNKSAMPQDVVEADLKEWKGVWDSLQDKAEAPWRGIRWEEEESWGLEDITVEQFRKTARSFKRHTGVGVDWVSPHQFDWLSDDLIEALIKLWKKIEQKCRWPSQLTTALIHLIPKESGGRRPIAIIASLIRIWIKCRKPEVTEWKAQQVCDYDWMGKGKGAERAVWAQSVIEEAQRQRGRHTASMLLDLAKAYERVPLGRVWSRGLQRGFPRRLLALGLETCAFARRLVYRNAVSQAAETLTALLAGMGMAGDMLFLVLSEPIEEILNAYTNVHVCLVADDIKVMVDDKDVNKVAVKLDHITGELCERLEGDMGMKVSRDEGQKKGKTVAIASSRVVGKAIEKRMKRRGIGLQSKVKNLGIDFAAGGRKRKGKQAVKEARQKGAVKKYGRVLRLGKKLAPIITRATVIASVSYGAAISGVTEESLRRMRRMAARAYGPMQGRSVTARLWMEDADPAFVILRKQVVHWVEAVWSDLMPMAVMHDAWKLAFKEVAMSVRPHAAATGGAGTYWSALRRLGWTAPTVETVRIADGTVLYFGKGDPPEGTEAADLRAIIKYLKEDLESMALLNSGIARELADVAGKQGYARCKEGAVAQERMREGGRPAFGEVEQEERQAELWRGARYERGEAGPMPWLEPARQVLKGARRKGRFKAAAAMRSLIEGGWSTPRQQWAEGRRESDTCECGKEAGTVYHWLAKCEKGEEQRSEKCPKEVLRQATVGVWDSLYSRGIAAKPKQVGRVQRKTWWVDADNAKQMVASGTIYVDGSYKGQHWRSARAAWSAVHIDAEGVWRWTYSGALQERHVSSFRAELTAVYEVLRIALGRVCIYCDNLEVVKGVEKGKTYCTAAAREGADLWRRIWRIMDEIGDSVAVRWIPGHTTWINVLEGKITPHQHVGNDMADKAAKEARAWAEGLAPNKAYGTQVRKARAWYKWILDFVTAWPYKENSNHEGGEEKEREGRRREERDTSSNIRHEIWRIEGELKCRRCARTFGKGDLPANCGYETCNGTAAGRALAALTGNVNYAWAEFALPAIEMIKKGARLVRSAGVPEIAVDWGRLGFLAESIEGRHVLRGSLGEGAWQGLSRIGAMREGQGRGGSMTAIAGDSMTGEPEREEQSTGRRRITGKQPERSQEAPGSLEGQGQKMRRGTSDGLKEGGAWEEEEQDEPKERRRRLRGKQAPPRSEQRPSIKLRRKEKEWSRGHVIRRKGPLVFCARCGSYATKRFGTGLRTQCRPPKAWTSNATRARLQRLHKGEHPLGR